MSNNNAGHPRRSQSVEELQNVTTVKIMSESELKRQLSHDLANDPALSAVFNPPQIFSDAEDRRENVVVWNNSTQAPPPAIVSALIANFKYRVFQKL